MDSMLTGLRNTGSFRENLAPLAPTNGSMPANRDSASPVSAGLAAAIAGNGAGPPLAAAADPAQLAKIEAGALVHLALFPTIFLVRATFLF